MNIRPQKTVEFYLIRHTKPAIEAGICYGQLDCPVADDYSQQLLKISDYFKNKEIAAIYSSPLQRCALLAEDLAKRHCNKAVIYNDDFKEINFGDWEGKQWDDIDRHQIDLWNENRLHFQFPHGETPAKFHARVAQAWSILLSETCLDSLPKKIILIAHSGVICSLLCPYLNIPFEKVTELKIDYASVTRITFHKNTIKRIFINKKIK